MQVSAKKPKVSIPLTHGSKRFRELIIYISQKCASDKTYGATKINKILWLADFASYRARGVPITGTEYMRLKHGPVPKRMLPVKRDMMESGDIDEIEMIYHGKNQKRLVAKRAADLSVFSAEDIALVDEVIEELWGANAKICSVISHDTAWEVAPPGSSIPYQASFLADPSPSDSDNRWAKKLISKHGFDG